MELYQYQALQQFLETSKYSDGYSEKQKQQLKNAAKYFTNQNNILYHKDEEDSTKIQYVIKVTELKTILYNSHDNPLCGYLKFEATYNQIKQKYFWYNMRKTVQNYISNCEVCQCEGKRRRNEPLQTIKVNQLFGRVGIDIVRPLPKTSRNNQYIVIAMDYLTKWPEARAISDATARSVASFLYEDIIYRHGYPKELVSDNGNAFIS